MGEREVTLVGGPMAGLKVTVNGSGLNMIGEGVPDGYAAYYRPTRDRALYRFRGLAKVLATIPAPGAC